MKKIIINPHNCSRDEHSELLEYLTDKCWDFKDEETETPIEKKSTKTYYLFGSNAVELYLEDKFPHIMIKLDTSDYATFCYDSNINKPIELLTAYNGWNDYTEISEFEYNLLNDIE